MCLGDNFIIFTLAYGTKNKRALMKVVVKSILRHSAKTNKNQKTA